MQAPYPATWGMRGSEEVAAAGLATPEAVTGSHYAFGVRRGFSSEVACAGELLQHGEAGRGGGDVCCWILPMSLNYYAETTAALAGEAALSGGATDSACSRSAVFGAAGSRHWQATAAAAATAAAITDDDAVTVVIHSPVPGVHAEVVRCNADWYRRALDCQTIAESQRVDKDVLGTQAHLTYYVSVAAGVRMAAVNTHAAATAVQFVSASLAGLKTRRPASAAEHPVGARIGGVGDAMRVSADEVPPLTAQFVLGITADGVGNVPRAAACRSEMSSPSQCIGRQN
jgi:hypothetical protein